MQLSNNRDTWECLKILWTLICLDVSPGFWADHMTFVFKLSQTLLGYPRLQCFHPATSQNTMLSCLFHTMVDEVAYLGMDIGGERLNNEHKCIHCTCMFIMFIHLMHTWPRWCKTHRYNRYGRYQTFITDLPIEDPPHYQDLPDLIKVKKMRRNSRNS